MKDLTPVLLLGQLGKGLWNCGWFKGWIEIEKKENGYLVLWTDRKNSHNVLNGPAISVEYFNNGEIGIVCRTYINLCLVHDEAKKKELVASLYLKIQQAYKKKFKHLKI